MKRNNAKRVLALVLASAMLLQQGSVGIFAAETETVTEAQTEQMTEAKVEETQAPATEAPAPETKAEETQAPVTEAPAEETKAEETQAPATEATEAPTEETKTEETQTPTTEAPTGETKIEETQAPATEAPGAGTETEETQAPATEAPAESMTEVPAEKETETEETVVLDTVITQEVFRKTVEDTVQPMVKYTVKVTNKAKTADAEDVSVKVLLAKALSYSKEDGETAEPGIYEKLEDAVNADVFKDIELDDAVKDAYAEGGVVLWKDQKIAAGEKKEFVFFTAVEDGVADTEVLRNLWFVNDEEITGNGKIEWLNTELLKVEKELPTEFIYDDGNMVVTATLSDGAILPEGAQFVVTEKTLSEEEAALIEESLGEEQTMTGYVAYDMHFEVDGKEVEPENGTVSVSVSYEKAQALTPVNEGEEAMPEDGEVKMLHITDEQTVEDVTTDVDVKKNGKVREVGFTTDGFSTFVLMSSNEVMPIADDTTIYVKSMQIGTHTYNDVDIDSATGAYTGDFEGNTANNPLTAYLGKTVEFYANVPEDYKFEGDGVNTTGYENGKLAASFAGTDTNIHTIALTDEGGKKVDEFSVQFQNPIYVTTRLDPMRHIDEIHEYLGIFSTDHVIFSPNMDSNGNRVPLYMKNERIKDDVKQEYLACDGDTITLTAIGTSETNFRPDNNGAAETRIEQVGILSSETLSNGLVKKTAQFKLHNTDTQGWTPYASITFGSEVFYVAIRHKDFKNEWENGCANHFDIEIADGGTYKIKMEQTTGDGEKKTVETIYDTYVDSVMECIVYKSDDSEIGRLKEEEYYKHGSPEDGSQYELTSAYYVKDGKVVDENGVELGEADFWKGVAVRSQFKRSEVDHVVFKLRVYLKPKAQTINGTPNTDFSPDDIVTVEGVEITMNSQDVLDAFNKCPQHNGLDFTISADVSQDIKFAAVKLEAEKLLKDDDLQNGQFSFELYDQDPSTAGAKPLNTVYNRADGKILFDEISYFGESNIGLDVNHKKHHTYYIKEVKGVEKDIIYDSRIVKADVDVWMEGGLACVNVTYSYWENSVKQWIEIDSVAPTFVNYKSTPEKTEPTPGNKKPVKIGDVITYEVSYKNYREKPATVTVTDTLDIGLTYVGGSAKPDATYDAGKRTLTWTIENVAAGAEGKVSFQAKVNENAKLAWDYEHGKGTGDDDLVLNQAGVKVGDDPKVDTDIVENPVADPHKTEVTPGDRVMVDVGKEIEYKITWKNYKKEAATVVITDALDPGSDYVDKSASNGGEYNKDTHTITWTLENQEPGKAGEVTFKVKVNENAYATWTYDGDKDDLKSGEGKDYEVWNRASVKVGNDPKVNTEIVENPVPEKTELTPGAGVMTEVGKEITYEIHWKNGHDKPATVIVTDVLDPGVTFKEADNGGSHDKSEKGGTVTWTLNAAAAGEAGSEGSVKLTVIVNEDAYQTYTYDGDTPKAGKGKDYKVLNRAKVQVDHDPEVLTNIIPNPVPEKTEVTPGEGVMTEVGKDITYKIHWKNGHDTAADVEITDVLDPGVTFKEADNGGTHDEKEAGGTVTWTLEAQAAGAEGDVSVTVTVNENAYKTYTYGNGDMPTVGEGKDYEVLNRAGVKVGDDPKVLTNIIPNPVPEKTEVTPGEGVMTEVGKDITYKIHWKNGHDTATDVEITDVLDPGVTFKEADNGGTHDEKEAGGTVTWTLKGQAAGAEGDVSVTVTVNENAYKTYTYGDGDTPKVGEGKDYEVLNRAGVKVGDDPKVLTNIIPNPVPEKDEVTPGKGVMVGIGQDITYEIYWKNGHDEPATVTVTDKLDPGVTFKSADNGGTCKDGVVTWTLNAAAGEAGSVKLTVTVNENAYDTWQYGSGDKPTAGAGKDYEVLNRAAVQVGHDPKVLTNVIPNPVPEKTEVTPGKGVMVGIGQDITYEIHWKNGHDEPATVTVTDKLDPGVTFKSADNGGTCKDGVVTWTLDAAAAGEAGSEGSVKLTVTVNENAYKTYTYGDGDTPTAGDGKDYEVLNRAGVQVGHDPKVLTNIIPNPVPEKEETDPGANETVYVGDQITYEIHWKNGHDTAADVTVTDPLDEGLDFVSADQGGSYDSATRTVTWVIKNVAAGQSGKVTLVTKVNVNARKDDYIVENQAGVQVGNDPKVLTQIIPNPTPEEPRDGTIRVTKELTALGEDLYAADETFYVALFADEACTKRVTDIKALEFKNASSSTVTFKDIDIGRTYYVGEVNADGEVILAGLAEDGTIFTANFNEGKSAVVKNADGSTTVVFENTFENIPDGFYRSGKLNITKKLLGVDGKAMDSDETFYAGIFADAEHTELSGDVSENIVELSLGGGSSVSASVDVVCDPEGPTTLYVTEVTEDGRPVGKSFGYTVTVDNDEVSLDVDHTSADVTITNQLKEEPESESEEPTKSVKTGDDTPLMGYVLLMLAALAMAIVAETMRRRRRIER